MSGTGTLNGSGGRGAALTAEHIGTYWDASARTFDDWLDAEGSGPLGYPEAEARAWELLWRRVLGPPPQRVLDVGTGTGSVSLLLARLGYDVVGVDRSEAMLEVAAAKARKAGLRLALQVAPAERLPFTEGHFDAVVSKLVLWTLLEPEAAVVEWRRCTRSGGRVAAVDISYGLLGPFDRTRLAVARAWGARTGRDGARGYLADPGRLAQLPLWRASQDSFRNVFVRAGLDNVLVEELAGIDRLERRRLKGPRRIWPVLPRHLLEGTVPAVQAAHPTEGPPSSPEPSNPPNHRTTTSRRHKE